MGLGLDVQMCPEEAAELQQQVAVQFEIASQVAEGDLLISEPAFGRPSSAQGRNESPLPRRPEGTRFDVAVNRHVQAQVPGIGVGVPAPGASGGGRPRMPGGTVFGAIGAVHLVACRR